MAIRIVWRREGAKTVTRSYKDIEGARKFYATIFDHTGTLAIEGCVESDLLPPETEPTDCQWAPDEGTDFCRTPHDKSCDNCAYWREKCECDACLLRTNVQAAPKDDDEWAELSAADRTAVLAKQPVKPPNRRGIKFGSDWVVKVSRDAAGQLVNPKKPGSQAHGRFAKYLDGKTVEACLANGVARIDLDWDSKRGFIAISNPRVDAQTEDPGEEE